MSPRLKNLTVITCLLLAGTAVSIKVAHVGAAGGERSADARVTVLSAPPPASAIVVNSLDDTAANDGKCTLREAITAANTDKASGAAANECAAGSSGTDTITFSVTGTINLTSALPNVGSNMIISGPGANMLTIVRSSAGTQFRIFTVSATVTISGVTIKGGQTAQFTLGPPDGDNGGGISNTGTLALTGVTVSGNRTSNGGDGGLNVAGSGGLGGGIFNNGTITIINSTISGNQTGSGGGARGLLASGTGGHGGGIYNRGTMTVTNSTVSGNQTGSGGSGGFAGNGGDGGGIYNENGFGLTVSNSTVTANQTGSRGTGLGTSAGGRGGGIFNAGGTTIRSIIAAGNSTPDNTGDVNGIVHSHGYNLIQNTGNLNLVQDQNVGTNITGQDPQLLPLADNGGPTPTHALRITSPAIDKGRNFATDLNNSPILTDQRGQTRPVDQSSVPNATNGDGTDIGAFEISVPLQTGSPSLVVNTTSDTSDGYCSTSAGGCTLHEAIDAANTLSGANTITFSDGTGGTVNFHDTTPETIQLRQALPDLASDITISGSGANILTVARSSAAGNPQFRIFKVTSGATVTISGLAISNGQAADGTFSVSNPTGTVNGDNGGGILNQGTLTLLAATISGNRSGKGVDSVVGNGGTGGSGGAIFSDVGSRLIVTNSAVTGNQAGSGGSASIGGNGGNGGNGAIFSAAGSTITITNSTISDNQAGDGGRGGVALPPIGAGSNGISGFGGGFYSAVGTITISNCTVTADQAGNGGGIFNAGGTITLRSTIIAGNSATSNSGPDINGTVHSQGHNLIQKTTNATIIDDQNAGTNITNVSPNLGPLAMNGGPTPTHKLLLGSPAIDKGDDCVFDNSCTPALSSALTTDQRGNGFARKVGSDVDIGAFEANYAIAATAGTPQTAPGNSAFGTQLQATVTESGINQSGILVTFTAPISGPSGTFQGTGTNTATATTDINGVATAPLFTANGTLGPYSVAASISSNLPAALFTLTNLKLNQTITLAPISDKTFGDADFPVSATTDAIGLSVSLSASGKCTIDGNTVHLIAPGSCQITAFQGGDSNYNAAIVSRSFNIAKAATTTTVTANDATFDGQPHGGTASVTGAAGLNQSLTVSYQGRNATVYGPSNTAPTNIGDYTASASFAGDTNYAGSNGSKNFQITKGSQTITFGPLANKTFGDADFSLNATASSGLAVSFSARGNCTATGNTAHLSGAGSCTITASQAGDGTYSAAPDVPQSFTIAKASTATALSSSSNPSAVDEAVTFSATVTSSAGTPTGTIAFKDNGGTISSCGNVALIAATATCTTASLSAGNHALTADYSGDTNFNTSTGSLPGGQTVMNGFRFSQASYTVAERVGPITITVQRTGDPGPAGSVDYETDDGSIPTVAVPCSVANGKALDRCDYELAAGRLNFAAGETQKTFVVLINDDSYVEGAETTTLRLLNPVGGVLTQQSTATLQIIDDATESAGNVIDDDQNWVLQHYRDFLNREADTDGLKFWVNQITVCGTDQQCRAMARINTSAAFYISIEFHQTGFFVERVYKAAFGDAVGTSTLGGAHQLNVPFVRFRTFMRDAQQIRGTPAPIIVLQGAWTQQLADNKQAFALDFVQRPDFMVRYSTVTAASFVDSLNANAGGVLNDADRSALIAELSPNPADATLRADVLSKIAENATLQTREFNRAFVLMQYFGYLRRNPDDAQDTDYSGYEFWLKKLDQFNGDYVNSEMVRAFISSDEYRKRFGP
jgi:CSLREA domain-containing protein